MPCLYFVWHHKMVFLRAYADADARLGVNGIHQPQKKKTKAGGRENIITKDIKINVSWPVGKNSREGKKNLRQSKNNCRALPYYFYKVTFLMSIF